MSTAAPRRWEARALKVRGAIRTPYPGFVEPCLATPRDSVPTRGAWVHEIKHDGYRAQSHLVGGRAMIYTRRGYDWTETFASIAEALRTLTVREVILDGEAVVPDERGISDYHKLQEDVAKGRIDRLVYFAFDLLYLDGVDVRGAQLTERKRLLAELLAKVPENGRIQLARHIEADASAVFKQACSMNIEGIVAIAAPVTWREMEEQDARPDQFTIAQPYPPRRKRRPVTVVE